MSEAVKQNPQEDGSQSPKSVKVNVRERSDIYVAKSLRISIINWGNVLLTYLPYVFYLMLAVLMAQIVHLALTNDVTVDLVLGSINGVPRWVR